MLGYDTVWSKQMSYVVVEITIQVLQVLAIIWFGWQSLRNYQLYLILVFSPFNAQMIPCSGKGNLSKSNKYQNVWTAVMHQKIITKMKHV